MVDLRSGLTLLYCALAASIAQAQTVPPEVNRDAERLQERERERVREREEQFRQSQEAPPQATPIPLDVQPSVEGGRCAAIRSVAIAGMTRYPQRDFAGDLAKLTGDCVSINDINAVLRVITNRYIRDGYVTSRAVIGPQDLNDGILEIIVVEGGLDTISSEKSNQSRGYSRGALATAFPGTKGRQLNLRDLEQGVDQLARLGWAEPDIDIVPAELPGASNVIVRAKRVARPVRASVSANNDGQASTGRFQGTASLDIDSPLGIADFWSLYYSHDLEGRSGQSSEGYGGFVSLPYGYTTLTLSGGAYNFQSILRGAEQSFANTGVSINGSATVDHLLFRDGKTKFSGSGSIALLDTENRIQGIRLSTSSYRLVTAAIDFHGQRRIGKGLASAEIGYTRGLNILGANAAATGPGGARLTFNKLEASFGYQAPFTLIGVPFNYSGLLRGAAAFAPVFPAQRFSVGGSSTVRGFRDDGISGQFGLVTRQQISFGLFEAFRNGRPVLQTRTTGFIGYDGGGILPRPGDPFERGFLHSAIGGLRINNRHIASELSAAAPISAPTSVRHRAVEFTATVRLSW